jgi:acyl-CoA thioesterase I
MISDTRLSLSGKMTGDMSYGALSPSHQMNLLEDASRLDRRRFLGAGLAAAVAATALGVTGLASPAAGQTQAARRPLTLVALGDSLTAGYGLPPDAAFPVVLERELRARGHAVTVVNAGVSGDTMSGGLNRLDWSVGEGVDGVILELGANDALRGVDPAITSRALDGILDRLAARNIPVLLSGMRAPPNYGAEYAARFDAIHPRAAAARKLLFDPFFLEGVAGNRALNLADGIHPTAEGVRIIVRRILPKVERFLEALPR